jgi:hypothetical protein
MRYLESENLKLTSKLEGFVIKHIDGFFVFLLVLALSTFLEALVYTPLLIPYYIFSMVTGMLLGTFVERIGVFTLLFNRIFVKRSSPKVNEGGSYQYDKDGNLHRTAGKEDQLKE